MITRSKSKREIRARLRARDPYNRNHVILCLITGDHVRDIEDIVNFWCGHYEALLTAESSDEDSVSFGYMLAVEHFDQELLGDATHFAHQVLSGELA